jgi:apolipoprotein N-acyltransferase
LGHTQVQIPVLIQIADLFGAYGVSFLIMLAAAAAAGWIPLGKPPGSSAWWRDNRQVLAPTLMALLAMVSTMAYGRARLSATRGESSSSIKVALIQGSIDTVFDGIDHTTETLSQYVELSRNAIVQQGPFDLLVWPESMYAYGWVTVDAAGPMHVPEGIEPSATAYRDNKLDWQQACAQQARFIAQALGTRMIVGAPRLEFGPEPMQRFNSALYLDTDGTLLDAYDKMHRVLFGEYIPLGNIFPWLYRLSPMGDGLAAGTTPKCFRVGGVRLAPSICFENIVPHLLRRQYIDLRAQGEEPDALVTITNDGWFWGSSLLDVHLACGVFRAIELRRPLLIAANTGFSAWIDPQGRVLKRGPRRDTGVIVASVTARGPSKSVYLAWGDVPAGVCAGFCGLLAVALGFSRRTGPALA